MNRRLFLQQSAAAATLATVSSRGQSRTTPAVNKPNDTFFPANGTLIPDDGWHLWIDEYALWTDDLIHLPGTFDLATLPANPPTGGWTTLDTTRSTGPNSALTTLPSTVEQHFWGKFGSRSYTPEEYRYAADDPAPQNGAYQGVSWWWREIEIPASMHGKRLLLQVRGARMRAEVYLNERLVTCESEPLSNFTREIWVANARPRFEKHLSIAVAGALPAVRHQLSLLEGIEVAEFSPDRRWDLIVTSGLVKGSKLDRAIGDETGLEAQPAQGDHSALQAIGHIPDAALAAVQQGTPLLCIVPDDFLADGVAKQLAGMSAFTYHGQVGDTRAPWMGNWLFVREHPTFSFLPVNRVLGVHYQAHGKASNGLLIEQAPGAEEPVVIMGYSRDHDRQAGAASLLCKLGAGRLLLHRAPEFSAPLQQRWLTNSVAYLTQVKLK